MRDLGSNSYKSIWHHELPSSTAKLEESADLQGFTEEERCQNLDGCSTGRCQAPFSNAAKPPARMPMHKQQLNTVYACLLECTEE
jgi:hypothetical protein